MKLPKITIVKTIRRGEMIPPFYGVAWCQYHQDAAVCLPVPFNLLAAFFRAIWIFLRHGWRPVPIDSRAAYIQGRRDMEVEILGEDPTQHCEVYREKGCAHIGGPFCLTRACPTLKRHREWRHP